jgi:hypothetical protein
VGGLGPDALTGELIGRFQEDSAQEFLAGFFTSPHLDQDQMRHSLTLVCPHWPAGGRPCRGGREVAQANPCVPLSRRERRTTAAAG